MKIYFGTSESMKVESVYVEGYSCHIFHRFHDLNKMVTSYNFISEFVFLTSFIQANTECKLHGQGKINCLKGWLTLFILHTTDKCFLDTCWLAWPDHVSSLEDLIPQTLSWFVFYFMSPWGNKIENKFNTWLTFCCCDGREISNDVSTWSV